MMNKALNLKVLILFLCSPFYFKSFSQTIVYKSKDTVAESKFTLNFIDFSYTYSEEYILKPGYDVGYFYKSEGKFKQIKDTLFFTSSMPTNDVLYGHIHQLTAAEIAKNKFSYIYPIEEPVDSGFVKIYFDNIAEISDYTAFTLINNELQPLKIKEKKKLSGVEFVQTKNNKFYLFHYLIIEKPTNNIMLIDSSKDHNTSKSYLFDFNKIHFSSFHFYTRVYNSYYDFTGLKFIICEQGIQLNAQPNDFRYQFNDIVKNEFLKLE